MGELLKSIVLRSGKSCHIVENCDQSPDMGLSCIMSSCSMRFKSSVSEESKPDEEPVEEPDGEGAEKSILKDDERRKARRNYGSTCCRLVMGRNQPTFDIPRAQLITVRSRREYATILKLPESQVIKVRGVPKKNGRSSEKFSAIISTCLNPILSLCQAC